jgi:gamma-glutamyltranspeptidase/glutathione hydrolase
MLNVLEPFELRRQGRWSPETVHLIIEAMKRAYRDRASHLGDADFVSVPAHLTTKEYARELARQIDRDQATPSASLAGDIPLADESPSTTHFSVMDGRGMAVSNTYTLEQSYGARVVVRGAGFLLNNEMGDFNWRPGHTDRSGAIGTSANVIAPRKRMLSSQTPVILTRAGRVAAVTGSPGGRTIINTVLCVVLNLTEFEMSPRDAVDAPRLHHAWFPGRVQFEGIGQPEYESLIARLRELGHTVADRPTRQGDAHTIWVDPSTGRYIGAADQRRSGAAAGY